MFIFYTENRGLKVNRKNTHFLSEYVWWPHLTKLIVSIGGTALTSSRQVKTNLKPLLSAKQTSQFPDMKVISGKIDLDFASLLELNWVSCKNSDFV